MEVLTDKLYYQNLTFYFVKQTDNDRFYECLDELNPKSIVTAPCDYDGALIGMVNECFRDGEDDDLIRYFDSVTGKEECYNNMEVITMPSCPCCNQELEQADYLEGKKGFETAYICMNEDECDNAKYYDVQGNEII